MTSLGTGGQNGMFSCSSILPCPELVYFNQLQLKVQILTGQRMVGIDRNFFFGNGDNLHRNGLSLGPLHLQSAPTGTAILTDSPLIASPLIRWGR